MRAFLLAALAVIPASVAFAQKAPSPDLLRQKAVADSNDPGVHYELAMALWERKEWDAAEASLRTAIRIAPSYADAYLALSSLGSARGEKYWKNLARQKGDSVVENAWMESQRYYRRAFLLNPLVNLKPLGKYEGPETFAAVTPLAGLTMRVRVPWARPMKDGINALYQGNYAEAFIKLDEALKTALSSGGDLAGVPAVLLWHHSLAAAHADSFDIAAQDMDALYTQSVDLEERNPERTSPLLANDYRFFVSTLLYLGGHFDQAVAGFQQSLVNDISLYVAHVQLARMYEASEKWDEAVLERERALGANPEDPGLMVELAATYLRRGRAADAVPHLESAARLNPRDARVPYLLGQMALSGGDNATARRWLEQFIVLAPSSHAGQVAAVRKQLEKVPQ